MFEIITQAALMEENLFSFNWYMFFSSFFSVIAAQDRMAAVLIQQTCLFTHNKTTISLSLSEALIVHLTPPGLGRLL